MQKYFCLVSLILYASNLFGQEKIKSYVEKNIVSIQSIQPSDTDYSDLEQIGNTIGDAKIVMLGEQEHGDGATFLAKTRLVKYLHEKKGFNVLAFESDFFGMNEGWDKVPKLEDSIKFFLSRNILPAWSVCRQCDDLLYSYVPKTYQTQTPLILSGFDSQFNLNYSNYNINKYIDNYLKQTNIPFVSSPDYKKHFLSYLSYVRFNPESKPTELKNFEIAIGTILSQLKSQPKDEFGLKVLENIQESAKRGLIKDRVEIFKIRDKQMAENLNYLVKTKFPNEKIIVWAANAHIMKNTPDAIKKRPYKWMGTYFTEDSQNNSQTYVLGFNSKRGITQLALGEKPKEVTKPSKNGFETWIDEKHKYAFVDFKAFKKANSSYKEFFTLKGEGHNNFEAIWTDIFDGVFYIRDMEPCVSNSNSKIYKR